jgi:hypothetical protein
MIRRLLCAKTYKRLLTASEPAVANNQVAARKGTIGSVVDATMSPGKPLPVGTPTRTSEEGEGEEP